MPEPRFPLLAAARLVDMTGCLLLLVLAFGYPEIHWKSSGGYLLAIGMFAAGGLMAVFAPICPARERSIFGWISIGLILPAMLLLATESLFGWATTTIQWSMKSFATGMALAYFLIAKTDYRYWRSLRLSTPGNPV